MMVGRLGSFQEGICSGAMLNFRTLIRVVSMAKNNEQTHGIRQSAYHMQSATRMNNAALELKILLIMLHVGNTFGRVLDQTNERRHHT